MTLDELEAAYNRVSKTWRSQSRSDRTIAVVELIRWESAARTLQSEDGDELADELAGLRQRIEGKLEAKDIPEMEY